MSEARRANSQPVSEARRANKQPVSEARRANRQAVSGRTIGWLDDHDRQLRQAMATLRQDASTIDGWGRRLARVLTGGGRLLVAGNGGSAAEAQHLTAELVGRFLAERRPLSAICLSAETSSLTAIVNDYGSDEMFARQVDAHARAGDVLLLLSTSGRSPNVLCAADRARRLKVRTWALTGPGPNPLAGRCDEAVTVNAPSTAAVQAVHLVAIHALCAALDARLLPAPVPMPARGPLACALDEAPELTG